MGILLHYTLQNLNSIGTRSSELTFFFSIYKINKALNCFHKTELITTENLLLMKMQISSHLETVKANIIKPSCLKVV